VNYLAHGLRHIDRPFVLAGTALPDWMRHAGLRLPAAGVRRDAACEPQRQIALGVERHVLDDRTFHRAPAFVEGCRSVAARLREVVPGDRRFRASFFAHVLIELALDAEIERRSPGLVDRYYASLERVPADDVGAWVDASAGAGGSEVRAVFGRFLDIRFLADYAGDAGLAGRLSGLGRRAGLPPLPAPAVRVVGLARALVRDRFDDLVPA
jgi:hypothetical protein